MNSQYIQQNPGMNNVSQQQNMMNDQKQVQQSPDDLRAIPKQLANSNFSLQNESLDQSEHQKQMADSKAVGSNATDGMKKGIRQAQQVPSKINQQESSHIMMSDTSMK